jgi:hypothetical protein
MPLESKNNSRLTALLNTFQPVTLAEMDTVKLMNRTDIKFFFNAAKLTEILERANESYFVLEISGSRQFRYLTTYFDTPEFLLYNEHQNGKLNRYKIRQRRYDATGAEFFEIKFKTNKGRTLKSRIENNQEHVLNEATDFFLKNRTPYKAANLNKVLRNDFIRITLVNKEFTERATLDYDISFSNFIHNKGVPQLGILEIKQDKESDVSPLAQIMKNLGIRPKGISKYCLGVALLCDGVKTNRMKPQLLKINNLVYGHTSHCR